MFRRGASRPGGTGLGPALLGIDFIIRPAFLQVAGCLRVATGDPDASVAQVRHAHSPSPFQWLPGSFSGQLTRLQSPRDRRTPIRSAFTGPGSPRRCCLSGFAESEDH